MDQIEYCDKPLELSWNPAWNPRDFCDDAQQADIDAWFIESDALWISEPEILLIEAKAEAERDVQAKFERLAHQWREETKTVSSTTDRVLHSAYQDIIGMGESVLKYIFRDMERNGGHWFWALRHITHNNPVPPQDAGKIQRMTEAWLRWGREQHYL
jgi:hypothetical protein